MKSKHILEEANKSTKILNRDMLAYLVKKDFLLSFFLQSTCTLKDKELKSINIEKHVKGPSRWHLSYYEEEHLSQNTLALALKACLNQAIAVMKQ